MSGEPEQRGVRRGSLGEPTDGAKPRLSLGLPVYNGERYLEQTLKCICAQSYGDFELIITDNASTDRTEQICRAFAAKDSRIRYYRHPRNLGAAPNYNQAFQLATGTYFKWLADDDLYEQDYLLKCIAALENDQAAVLAHSAAVDIDSEGKVIAEINIDLHVDAQTPHERFRYLSCIDHPCFHIFGVIRSDVLRRTPLIGSYVGSDRVLIAELALHGRFSEVPERLFLHREHPHRSTRVIPDLRLRAVWFDTTKTAGQKAPNLRLFGEYIAAIQRAPLRLRDRARCLFQLVRWWKYNGANVAADLRASVRLGMRSQP
jgi:glycosyltransferase involved in cell wall biosynthesis